LNPNHQTDAPEYLRLFMAIAIPNQVKDEIEKVQRKLRHVLSQATVRWTERDQFHLTLRFLGKVEAQRVTALSEAVNSAVRTLAPLQLRAEQVGFFPNARFPRVLWVGVRDPENRLLALQQAVQNATLAFSTEEPEQRFSGHVTLARIKDISRLEAATLSQAAAALKERVLGEWTAGSIKLMRSQLSAPKAIHSTLVTVPIGGN
jgi:2'-5' RNA ligase